MHTTLFFTTAYLLFCWLFRCGEALTNNTTKVVAYHEGGITRNLLKEAHFGNSPVDSILLFDATLQGFYYRGGLDFLPCLRRCKTNLDIT